MPHHITEAALDGIAAEALLGHIRAELQSYDLPLRMARDGALESDTGIGLMRIRATGTGLSLHLEAATASDLHMLREGALAHIERYDTGLPDRVIWSSKPEAGSTPPNFRLAEVIQRSAIGPRFLRLRLRAEGLESFAEGGLHIRMLLPPEGRAPVWPALSATGRTIWPSGADTLHTPAYTIRRIDPAAGHLDVDILVHGRGPTCLWASKVQPGARIGISGPGGGGHPKARHLVMAGDETALPAIARILEAAPPETQGQVLIEVETPEEIQPLARPAGVQIGWLCRRNGDLPLVAALRALVLPRPEEDRFAWFAAEKAQTAEARAYLRDIAGFSREHSYIAAYWTDTAAQG